MHKLDLPVDYREAAAIERRRNQEQQRKSRIFNAKTRTTGIDVQALEQQLVDRKDMELTEKKRHEVFSADAVRNDMIASLLDRRQKHDQRELNRGVNEFRSLHQQPNARREWDLYDPENLKKDNPARVSDDDPRCGKSSLQKFVGEDLNNKARRQFQGEQQQEWAEEQAREKAQAELNQNRADHLYDLKRKEMDERAMELQRAEEAAKRAINKATSNYNKALDEERKVREELQRTQISDDNATEQANHIYGDILTENPAAAQSAFGAHRVIPDRWKGMSPEQLADIRRTQDIQRRENQRLRDEEMRRNREWEEAGNANSRAAMLLEREQNRRERELKKHNADENRRLGSEHVNHLRYMDKEVYTNEPTAAYYMQFNTTTR